MIPVVVAVFIFVTTTHGQNSCNCRCSVPHYGRVDVCEWMNDNSPKVDSNRNEINFLKDETSKFMSFKNYFERNVSDKILPFISATQHAPENLRTSDNNPMNDLAGEIEKLKNAWKEQRDELNEKLETIEKNCLRITNSLSERVNAAEIRAVETENSVLQRINKTGEQTLEVSQKFMGMITNNEKQTLKTKEELLEKIKDVEAETAKLKGDFLVQENQQKNQTASVQHEFLVKVNELENETFKLKDDFQMKVTELKGETSNVRNELLTRMNESVNPILEMREEFLRTVNEMEENAFKKRNELKTQINHLENLLTQEVETQRERWIYVTESLNNTQIKMDLIKPAIREEINSSAENIKSIINETHLQKIYDSLRDLEMKKYRNMDSRIGDVEETVKNLTRTLNDDHIEQLYSRTFDAFKMDISSTIQKLQMKTHEIDKVLERLPTKGISSTISDIWSSIKTIRNSMANFQGQIDAIKQTYIPGKENKILIKKDHTKAVCKASDHEEPTLAAVFRAFHRQKNCGDVLPTDYLNTVTSSNRTSALMSSTEPESTIDKLLLLVLTKPMGSEEYENTCLAVMISRYWAVTSSHCVKDRLQDYYVNQINRNSVSSRNIKVRPFSHVDYEMPLAIFGDISLLNAEVPFNFDERKHPLSVACLPTSQFKDNLFGSAIFLGGTDLKNSDWFLSLHTYDVCLMSDDECASFYDSYDSNMICTQYDESALKTCENSKGGLLFKKIVNKIVLIGIVESCGSLGTPIIYTEVAHYAGWIESFPELMGGKRD